MAKNKNKNHPKKSTKTKTRSSYGKNNAPKEPTLIIRHIVSNGWIQNCGICLIISVIGVIAAMVTSTGIKAAAITFAGVGTVFLWLIAFLVVKYTIAPAETEFEGLLVPGNDLLPKMPSPIPQNALLVNLGGNIVYDTKSSFAVLSINDKNIISIDRVRNGVSISASIYGPDGRIVAMIDKNEFTVNPNNYFKKKRPNNSTLIVYNQQGEEAINVRFANPQHIIILGTFYTPRFGKLLVLKDCIIGPHNSRISNSFVGENKGRGAAFAFGSSATP